jgi:hypothetical protein
MRVNEATLERVPLFANLEPERKEQLATVCDELEVAEGTVLTKEGDFGFAMFAIVEGAADVIQGGQVIRPSAPGACSGRSPSCRVVAEPRRWSPPRRRSSSRC